MMASSVLFFDNHHVHVHGVTIAVDVQRPFWTLRERLLWGLWAHLGLLKGDTYCFRLDEFAYSSGSNTYMDLARLRMRYAREIPEVGTVLSVSFDILPARKRSTLRPWWRRFRSVDLGGIRISPKDDPERDLGISGAAAKAIKGELSLIRPHWQCLSDSLSRRLWEKWEHFRKPSRPKWEIH
jgi:hypothetical protein